MKFFQDQIIHSFINQTHSLDQLSYQYLQHILQKCGKNVPGQYYQQLLVTNGIFSLTTYILHDISRKHQRVSHKQPIYVSTTTDCMDNPHRRYLSNNLSCIHLNTVGWFLRQQGCKKICLINPTANFIATMLTGNPPARCIKTHYIFVFRK